MSDEWFRTYRVALHALLSAGVDDSTAMERATWHATGAHGPVDDDDAPDPDPVPSPDPDPGPSPDPTPDPDPEPGQLGAYPPLDLGPGRGVLRYARDGLGIHLGVNAYSHATTSEAIADAGGKWVRARMLWKNIDKTDGTYDFEGPPDTQLDTMVREYNLRGIGVLLYVSLETHRGYPGSAGAKPYNDEGRANVARFAAEAARHFAGKRVMFELGNEPNIPNFWPIDSNGGMDAVRAAARQYGMLAREVVREMKRANPDCVIIGPSVTHRGGPEDGKVRGAHVYIEVLRDMGVLQLFDLLSFHFYSYEHGYPVDVLPPGTAPEESDIDLFKTLVGPDAPPIINTETGWRTDGSSAMDRLQAAYNLRDFLWGLANGIRLRMTFLHSQSGDMASYYMSEECVLAHRVLSEQLAGMDFVRRVPWGNHDQYVLEFAAKNGRRCLVTWVRDANTAGTLPVGSAARIVSMLGNTPHMSTSHEMKLTIEPQYVWLR